MVDCMTCGGGVCLCPLPKPAKGGIIGNANYYDPESIKGRIFDYFNKQTEKGVQKYGHTLDQCPDDKFDWRLMIIEELVDCIQYQQKEIVRLERENAELKTYVNNLISDKAFLEKLLNPSDGEN